MLMIQQFILIKKTPKINRSTSINMEPEKLCIWLNKLNKLSLTVEINKYMIFRKRRKISFFKNKDCKCKSILFSGHNN